MGLRAVPRDSDRPYFAPADILRRKHFSSGAADARVFRASGSASAADLPDLCAHRKPDPLLQPPVSFDVRSVRPWYVLVRTRADGQRRRRVRGGTLVRIRAVSHPAVVPPSGPVVAVDAVRLVRLPPLLRYRPSARARGRNSGCHRREPVMRLLLAL